MSSLDIEFSRVQLKLLRPIINKLVDVKIRKEAWTYNHGRDTWEFQVPSKEFYWYGRASNAYEARVEGWSAYLERFHEVEYERLSEAAFMAPA